MAIMGYTALADLDRARYNSFIRIKAAAAIIHPQFFEQENIEERTRQAVFTVWNKMAATPSDTLLTGTYDLTEPDPTTLTEAQVIVTAVERGRIVCSMQGIRETAILDVVEAKKQIVAINMAEGLDNAAAYAIYASLTPTETIAGPITPDHVLKAARTAEDTPWIRRADGLFAAVISPYTKADLFASVDRLKGFIARAQYAHPDEAYNYEIGAWMGFRWVVGPSAYHATVTGERHDYPIFFGQGAFGQANGYDPEIVVVYGLDAMQRKMYISWKAQRGYGVINTSACLMYDCKPTP